MLKWVRLDDASSNAPHEHAMKVREDTASQDDLATVGDVVDHGETCATVDVGDETILPGRQGIGADAALDAASGFVSSLISLEPLLEDAREALRWKRRFRHGHRVSSRLYEIVCFSPCMMSLLDAHRRIDAERHASLVNLPILHAEEVNPHLA